MQPKSRIIHAGVDRDPVTGASSVPLYMGSTYDQRISQDWNYGRSGNPTRDALEKALAELEGGDAGFAFSSGMAAMSSALMLFKPGDHVIACEDIYGGTFRALTTLFKDWGLLSTFVDTTDNEAIQAAIRPETRGIIVESPSNPLMKITDLAFVAAFARDHKLLSIIDNTFATPYLQQPISFGFDIVVHSATKFLNGHSDVIGGLIVTRTAESSDRVRNVQNAFGAVLGVPDSWLVLRGLKTLAVRMEAAQASTDTLARRVRDHRSVLRVLFPGLEDHPGHDLHNGQASGPGAVFSFELNADIDMQRFFAKLEMPLVAVSLGGVETIMSHPATMSHAAMPPAERAARGISDHLVRCSVGLEDPEDLWSDFVSALEH